MFKNLASDAFKKAKEEVGGFNMILLFGLISIVTGVLAYGKIKNFHFTRQLSYNDLD